MIAYKPIICLILFPSDSLCPPRGGAAALLWTLRAARSRYDMTSQTSSGGGGQRRSLADECLSDSSVSRTELR